MKIRELIQVGRPQSLPARARASSNKASPRGRIPMDEEQAASVAAVLQSMSSVEEEQSTRKSRPLGAPGKTFFV